MIREHSIPLKKLLVALLERGMKSGEFRRMDKGHTIVSIAGLTAHYFNIAPAFRADYRPGPLQQGELGHEESGGSEVHPLRPLS